MNWEHKRHFKHYTIHFTYHLLPIYKFIILVYSTGWFMAWTSNKTLKISYGFWTLFFGNDIFWKWQESKCWWVEKKTLSQKLGSITNLIWGASNQTHYFVEKSIFYPSMIMILLTIKNSLNSTRLKSNSKNFYPVVKSIFRTSTQTF